jgi:hypothetical protein
MYDLDAWHRIKMAGLGRIIGHIAKHDSIIEAGRCGGVVIFLHGFLLH